MKLPQQLNPKYIFYTLDDIDQTSPSYTLNRKDTLRRVFWTLACTSVCLLLIHYMKFFSSFISFLEQVSLFTTSGDAANKHYWYQQIRGQGFSQLAGYGWWTFWHVIGYVVIPYFVVRYLLRIPFSELGWKWNDTSDHWQGYLLLLTPILFFVFLVSQGQDFVNHYPFYKNAGRSWFDLISWELLYLLQFLCLEFFFRGFLINALRPAIGANAVWVMCVPYLMIHFPKLWLEATGAILFGLFLGILALRSRSIWGGFLVHAGIALSMDFASLYQQGKIPSSLFP